VAEANNTALCLWLQALSASIAKDKYSAVAYFCRGTVRFKLKQYSDALSDFEATNEQLNDNVLIDYKQLNFKFKLCKCEVLYNMCVVVGEPSPLPPLL